MARLSSSAEFRRGPASSGGPPDAEAMWATRVFAAEQRVRMNFRSERWNAVATYVSTAEKIEGPWTPFKKVTCEPDSKDSFTAQTDFLFEVRGTVGSFILWGSDRWSQRTKTGVGKNVWLPLHWNDEEPLLKWVPSWKVDVAAGTWTAIDAGPGK